MDKAKLLAMTTDIVSAHASANEMTQETLIAEIAQVYVKLASLAGVEGTVDLVVATTSAEPEELKPAVPLEAAFGAEKVFCMVCGQGMKTLKRHLANSHGLKPGQYRKQFGIPAGTALVAKNYSDARKIMAKELKLADRLVKARAMKGKKTAAPAMVAAGTPAKAAKKGKDVKAASPRKRTKAGKTTTE